MMNSFTGYCCHNLCLYSLVYCLQILYNHRAKNEWDCRARIILCVTVTRGVLIYFSPRMPNTSLWNESFPMTMGESQTFKDGHFVTLPFGIPAYMSCT